MERDAISIDRWGLGRGDGRDARSSRVDDDEGTDESATLWTVHRRGADASVRVGERGRGDSGRRRWGSRTFGETNGVTGSGSERIAGVGGEDGERGGVPGSASWSGTAIIADTSGDRGGSGGGGGGAGDGGATSAVPVDPDEILGVFFRGENIPMAMAGEAPVGVGRGRGGGARGGGIGEFLVVTAEHRCARYSISCLGHAGIEYLWSSLFSTSSCHLSTGAPKREV